jgi:hypothetical protein
VLISLECSIILDMERPPKRPEGNPSSAVVWNRLRELQILCGKDRGLLFIGGVDGKYNIGSTKAINYVISGLSGREVYQKSDDKFEDVSFVVCLCASFARPNCFCQAVLVISADGSFLHVGSSDMFWKLMASFAIVYLCENCFLRYPLQPTVGPIGDLQLLTAADDEASDMDLSEVITLFGCQSWINNHHAAFARRSEKLSIFWKW